LSVTPMLVANLPETSPAATPHIDTRSGQP
jgi:hypothetical protein